MFLSSNRGSTTRASRTGSGNEEAPLGLGAARSLCRAHTPSFARAFASGLIGRLGQALPRACLSGPRLSPDARALCLRRFKGPRGGGSGVHGGGGLRRDNRVPAESDRDKDSGA